MIAFDPTNPFPLLYPDQVSYKDAQIHSEEIDKWLGLDTQRNEALIRGREKTRESSQQTWEHLPARSFLTPYTELRLILSQLNPKPGETIIDLGAGYGRMAFILGKHFPEVRFIGFECVSERVESARRALALYFTAPELLQMKYADLAAPDFVLPTAEYYFMYDYGAASAIEKTLQDLKRTARSRKLTLVARGRASRHAVEKGHPWLAEVIAPEHYPHYSIYRSA